MRAGRRKHGAGLIVLGRFSKGVNRNFTDLDSAYTSNCVCAGNMAGSAPRMEIKNDG